MTHRCVRRAAAVMSLSAVAALSAQDRLPRWKIDPHTRNEPELMQAAGYVSFGPFEFGELSGRPVTTEIVERRLEPARILWVETAHFRIGSALEPGRAPSGREDRLRLREELGRLAERLPRVRPAASTFGPWLRLHLIAQRMEELYAEVQGWLGVTDQDFRAGAGQRPGTYMGEGPYLGQPGKFLVLVLQSGDHHRAYVRQFIGLDNEVGQRWNFRAVGSLVFATAAELRDRRFEDDAALHGHLVFNVTRNLLDGYRFYTHDLPAWISDGVAHWFERRVSPRWNSVPESSWAYLDTRSVWQWEKLAVEFAETYEYAPLADVLGWRDSNEFGFEDHVLIWSRIDFLMAQGPEKFAALMAHLTGRSPGDPVATTLRALQEVYGTSPEEFDRRWLESLKR